MADKPQVKTTKTPTTDQAKHAAIYKKAKTTTEKEVPCANNKTKVITTRTYSNGVVKSSLKGMYKMISGRKVWLT